MRDVNNGDACGTRVRIEKMFASHFIVDNFRNELKGLRRKLYTLAIACQCWWSVVDKQMCTVDVEIDSSTWKIFIDVWTIYSCLSKKANVNSVKHLTEDGFSDAIFRIFPWSFVVLVPFE